MDGGLLGTVTYSLVGFGVPGRYVLNSFMYEAGLLELFELIFITALLCSNSLVVRKLWFTMESDLPPRFSVSLSSGVISTTMPIDYEERAVYHLTLIARDGGGTLTSPNQANTLIVVEVLDVNDHTPQCFPSSTVVTLAENTAFPNFLTISVSSTTYATNILIWLKS